MYVIKQGIMWLQYKCPMCAQTFSVSYAPKETDDLVLALKKLTEFLGNIEPIYEKDMQKTRAKELKGQDILGLETNARDVT